MKRNEALAFRHKIETAAGMQTDKQALDSIDLYAPWQPDMDAEKDKRYQYHGVLYRCVQAHHTQADWTPDVTPALWAVVSLEEWPSWKQPTGATDAYRIGDKVTHNDKHWTSDIDYNTYEPGVYGWTEA